MLIGVSGQNTKHLKIEEQFKDVFTYDAMVHIKQIVNNFKHDPETFKFVIKDAIYKWKRCDQKALADFLVSHIFGEIGEPICEYTNTDKDTLTKLQK